jgi:hypothetical protein
LREEKVMENKKPIHTWTQEELEKEIEVDVSEEMESLSYYLQRRAQLNYEIGAAIHRMEKDICEGLNRKGYDQTGIRQILLAILRKHGISDYEVKGYKKVWKCWKNCSDLLYCDALPTGVRYLLTKLPVTKEFCRRFVDRIKIGYLVSVEDVQEAYGTYFRSLCERDDKKKRKNVKKTQ